MRRTLSPLARLAVVPVLSLGIGLLAACGEGKPAAVQAGGTVSDAQATPEQLRELAPMGKIGLAGPDGRELDGISFDLSQSQVQVRRVAERMESVGRNLTDYEARAFMFVEPVVVTDDESGKVVGYWADRYYPAAEFEAALPRQEAIVEALERTR